MEQTKSKGRRGEDPRRIEVVRRIDRDGSSSVTLRDLNYADGVGWFSQKSITLADDEIDALIRQLASVRRSRSAPRPKQSAASARKRAARGAVVDIRPYLEG